MAARRCFAQLNPLLSLLKCHLTIEYANWVNWQNLRAEMRHKIFYACKNMFANWPKGHWKTPVPIATNRISAGVARANATEREVISRQQLMQASVQHYPIEDLSTPDTSCRPGLELNTSLTHLLSVQRKTLASLYQCYSASNYGQPTVPKTIDCSTYSCNDAWKRTTERTLSAPWLP